eukprot:5345669-Pleurochrysis_carterae.AAC.1
MHGGECVHARGRASMRVVERAHSNRRGLAYRRMTPLHQKKKNGEGRLGSRWQQLSETRGAKRRTSKRTKVCERAAVKA